MPLAAPVTLPRAWSRAPTRATDALGVAETDVLAGAEAPRGVDSAAAVGATPAVVNARLSAASGAAIRRERRRSAVTDCGGFDRGQPGVITAAAVRR